jgi:hypothetical protein
MSKFWKLFVTWRRLCTDLPARLPGTCRGWPPARASVSSGVGGHLHFFAWQVLGELIVTVAKAVADPPFPVQVIA